MSTVRSPAGAEATVAEGGGAGYGEAVGMVWVMWAAAIVPVMFILPMYIFPFPIGVSNYNGRRFIEILWAAGLLVAFVQPSIRSRCASMWAGLSTGTRVGAMAFLGWSLLSALLASAPSYSLREWSLTTLLLVAALPLAAVLGARRTKTLEVIGLSLVLYAILVGADPLKHGFGHPRFLGQALAVVVPAVLFSGNLILALISAPALAIGILNGSRALMLTMVVVTMAAFVLWPNRRERMGPGLAGLAVAALLVGAFALLGVDSSLQAAIERGTSSTGRTSMWLDAIGRFARAPLLGVGPGMLARAPGVANWAGHPHNSVLLIAAEMGIVGLAATAVLVTQGIRRLPRLTTDRRPWALALIGGGFHSLFSGTTVMPASQVMLVLALALALPGAEDGGASADSGRATCWVLAGLGVAAFVILLATFSLPGADITTGMVGPRFFQRGLIP